MKKLRIYLDTSVISFLFADDAPDLKRVTIEFFDRHLARYDVAISDIVLLELGRTKNAAKRRLLRSAVEKFRLPVMTLTNAQADEVRDLAARYMREGVIPSKKHADAMHTAVRTVLDFDILLSWNFEHLANIRKQMAVNAINEKMGCLKKLNLLTPLGVMSNEN